MNNHKPAYRVSIQTMKYVEALNAFDECTAKLEEAFCNQYGNEEGVRMLTDYLSVSSSTRDNLLQYIGASLIEDVECTQKRHE